MRVLAALDELANDGDTGGSQQFAELFEVHLAGRGGDAQGALAGAPLGWRSASGARGAGRAPGRRARRLGRLGGDGQAASAPSRSTASVRRSSGVVSEMRKKPSPLGP